MIILRSAGSTVFSFRQAGKAAAIAINTAATRRFRFRLPFHSNLMFNVFVLTAFYLLPLQGSKRLGLTAKKFKVSGGYGRLLSKKIQVLAGDTELVETKGWVQ